MSKNMISTIVMAATLATSPVYVATAFSAPEFVKEQTNDQWLASNLIGANVMNKTGENIGDINDIVFDGDNDVDAVVIGVGGFLGLGEKNVAVTYSSLSMTKDKDGNPIIAVPLSKTALEAAPEYKMLPTNGTMKKMQKGAKDMGEKAKETAKDISESAKNAYEKAKKSVTGN